MTGPGLSAVVVTPTRFAQVRRTVRHLREQDVADQVELVLVAPTPESVADAAPGELAGFAGVQFVGVGPIPNVDRASAAGVHASRGEVVAMVEDHAFPQPGYARALLETYRDPATAVVMPTVLNGNPRHALSWCNLLLAYGWWADPGAAGPLESCAGHNLTLRRELLTAFGDDLENRLGRDGTLVDDLRSAGVAFRLDGHARTAHVNPSRLGATLALRFRAGRLYAAQRAEAEGWTTGRRAVQALGGPLIPAVRLRRLAGEHLAAWPFAGVRPKIAPALLAALAADAAGQVAGVTTGVGDAMDHLVTFEMDRAQHVRRDDLPALYDPVDLPADLRRASSGSRDEQAPR